MANRWQSLGVCWLRAMLALGAVYGARWVCSGLAIGHTASGGEFDWTLDVMIGVLIGPWVLGLVWVLAIAYGVTGLVELTKRPGREGKGKAGAV